MQHHQPLAFLPIRDARHHERLFRRPRQFVQFFFNFDMRNHLSANFAESRQAVRNRQKSIFIHRRNIACHVPSILQHFRRLIRPLQISLHHIRSAHQKQSRLIERQRRHRFRINNPRAHSWQRMPNLPALRSHLPESRRAVIARIHRHHRRTLGRSISLHWPDSEAVLKRK